MTCVLQRLAIPALTVLLWVPTLRAQESTEPPARVDRAASRFVPGTSPGFHGEVEFSGGHTLSSGIREGTTTLADIDTTQTRFRYTGTFVPGGNVNWSIGLEAQSFLFGGTDGGPLPDGLHAVSVPVGMNWRWTDRWNFLIEISPGLYTDFDGVTPEAFNAPVLAGLTYSVSERLLLVLQVSLDPRRDVVLIGGPGVRWRFADRWTLSLLLPRPRLEFTPAEGWLIHAGGEITGGAYQLGEEAGSKRGRPELDDVNISYREIRAGLGVLRQLSDRWRLEITGGWTLDRRFVVSERNLLFNGDGAPYGRIALTCRY